MGLSLGLSLRQTQSHFLSHAQKLGLEQLLTLKLKLRHPDHPDAIKGLEGMQIAHEILKGREAVGVLIGGLAEAVWNQRRKVDELLTHKDVDVAVLDDDFKLSKPFEGGVDWWMPQTGNVTIKTDATRIEGIQKRWHENGNGAVLSFGMAKISPLSPGLYIPDPEWVIRMREYEATANIDYGRVETEFNDEVFEKFREKMRKTIKTRLPKFILDAFPGHILSPQYEQDYSKTDAISLEMFDLETLRAIHGTR